VIGGVSAEEKRAITAHLHANLATLASDAALYGPHLGHPLDPRTPDDDGMTEWDADEQARDELLGYSEALADWIAKQCDGKRDPIRPGNPTTWDVAQLAGVPHLLTLIVTGSASQIIAAAHQLRDLYLDAHGTDIAQRARELLAADRGG
jgi:hypothetical protein